MNGAGVNNIVVDTKTNQPTSIWTVDTPKCLIATTMLFQWNVYSLLWATLEGQVHKDMVLDPWPQHHQDELNYRILTVYELAMVLDVEMLSDLWIIFRHTYCVWSWPNQWTYWLKYMQILSSDIAKKWAELRWLRKAQIKAFSYIIYWMYPFNPASVALA